MSTATTARLATSKRLYLDAQRAEQIGDGPARRQAVIGFDTAIEDALLTLAGHLEREVPRRANRAQVCELVEAEVPNVAMALRVRRIRNPAMHAGTTPSVEETEEAALATETLLREVFAAAGHDFDRFTVTRLVCNELVREPLNQAEDSLDSGEPVAALGYTALALHRLEGLAQEAALVTTGLDPSLFLNSRWEDEQLTADCADGADRQAEQLLISIASTVLTRDLAGLIRLRLLLSGIQLNVVEPGSYETHAPVGMNVDPAVAQWAIGFVASMAYRIERSIPDLRQPVQAPREQPFTALPVRVQRF